ncbi:MAG: hypothetical protein AAFX39_11905 [Pseudomonadota bacterium]
MVMYLQRALAFDSFANHARPHEWLSFRNALIGRNPYPLTDPVTAAETGGLDTVPGAASDASFA